MRETPHPCEVSPTQGSVQLKPEAARRLPATDLRMFLEMIEDPLTVSYASSVHSVRSPPPQPDSVVCYL